MGKRGEVSIQVKPQGGTQGQVPGGQAGKGKRGGDAKAPGDQKPNPKPDGNRTPVGKAKDTAKPAQQTDGEPASQRQRPPRTAATAGARNLLSAALKSSTRDTPRPKASGEGEAAKGARPAPVRAAGGTTGNVAGGDAAAAAGGAQTEKAKRPPRNRNRKPAANSGAGGGEQAKTGDQAGAASARIDA